MEFSLHHWYMKLAMEEAYKGEKNGEVPVGAICVSDDGKVVAFSSNTKEAENNPTGHAEIACLSAAGKAKGNWRLTGHTLYVTLEPCPMCMMALVHSRLELLVFGTYDTKGGALSLGYNFHNNPKLNHRFSVIGGFHHYETAAMLSNFFKLRRTFYKS